MFLLLSATFPKLCSSNSRWYIFKEVKAKLELFLTFLIFSSVFSFGFLRVGGDSVRAIHMLTSPRWSNEEIQRLLSRSSDSKWAEHKELSVKSWMSSTGPLPKTSGLSTPFKATFPITFTQTVQTKTTEMWGGTTLPSSFLWQMSTAVRSKA